MHRGYAGLLAAGLGVCRTGSHNQGLQPGHHPSISPKLGLSISYGCVLGATVFAATSTHTGVGAGLQEADALCVIDGTRTGRRGPHVTMVVKPNDPQKVTCPLVSDCVVALDR